jgi:hypothetical protein
MPNLRSWLLNGKYRKDRMKAILNFPRELEDDLETRREPESADGCAWDAENLVRDFAGSLPSVYRFDAIAESSSLP